MVKVWPLLFGKSLHTRSTTSGDKSVAPSWREQALAGTVNGVADEHMLEAAWQLQESLGLRVSFVQASSAEMFGQPHRRRMSSGPWREPTPTGRPRPTRTTW